MRLEDRRPAFAGLANLTEQQLQSLPTPCYLLDEAQLRRNGQIMLELQQRTGCRALLAQKAFSNFDVYPVLAPYLAGTEASGLYESRLGREQLPEKENHVFCAAYRADEFPELLQYAVSQRDVRPLEAQALLAGIVLDTKNFSVRTGSRTFESAAYLRKAGADPVEVKKLFQADLDATILKYQIIQAARLYRNEIAIAAVETPVPRAIASQASDELLNISGISASFVLYPSGDQVMISARSIGSCNVQMVLEPLGGGGNAATAGAQIRGGTVRDVLRELVASIDKFYE